MGTFTSESFANVIAYLTDRTNNMKLALTALMKML